MTEREKISQLMDMLRRMCEAMKCEDCPLSFDGLSLSESIIRGGICEFAVMIVLEEVQNERDR